MLVTFGICFKQHFDTRYLVFYNTSPPRMFLSLDLLWEYRIQYGANGPLYVTSSYSTWIFCTGISGFATDCPCGVWCRGLTTCLLHVGPPFVYRILNNSWAVGLTQWIMNLIFWIDCLFSNIYLYPHLSVLSYMLNLTSVFVFNMAVTWSGDAGCMTTCGPLQSCLLVHIVCVLYSKWQYEICQPYTGICTHQIELGFDRISNLALNNWVYKMIYTLFHNNFWKDFHILIKCN